MSSDPSNSPHLTPGPIPGETVSAPPPKKRGPIRRGLKSVAIDLAPIKVSRDFRLLYLGQTVSFFGSMMTYVVMPWQMYQLTKSSLAVGLLGAVEFVPMLLLAFVGGALADYVDRRRLILMTELATALCVGVLAFNSLLAQPRVWIIYVIAGFFAALNGLQRPSREALIQQLVPTEHMTAVAALHTLRFSIGAIIGPAAGGLLASSFGPIITYSIDFATFSVSLITLWMVRSTPRLSDADRPSLRSIAEGLRYARSRPELLGTYLIDINAMFFGMPMALFPAYAESFGPFWIGPFQVVSAVGIMYAAPSVGSLLATLSSGWTSRIHRHGAAITLAAAVWGLAIIGFGLSHSLLIALAWLALAGAGDTISGLFRMAMWNQTIPDRLRGRLAGIEMISYMTGPLLGNAEAGLVATLFSLRTSIVSGGILCTLGSGLLGVLLPAFWRYHAREGIARRQAEEAQQQSATDG
ncbi:MAG: MFS transporter [Pyrinomonadaceae bacterium]